MKQTLLGLVVALMLAACGSPANETSAGSSGGLDQPVSSTPGMDDGAPQDAGPQKVTPRSGMADLHRVGWDEAKPSKNGRKLTITFWSGVEPCYVLDHVDVKYGEDDITVTLFEGHDPNAEDVACIEIALLKSVKVHLKERLTGRDVIDGAD